MARLITPNSCDRCGSPRGCITHITRVNGQVEKICGGCSLLEYMFGDLPDNMNLNVIVTEDPRTPAEIQQEDDLADMGYYER